MKSLNQAYSTRSTRRRYEAWFLRMGLADGSGAWWFRYLLLNPARSGCPGREEGMPVQVWAIPLKQDEDIRPVDQRLDLRGGMHVGTEVFAIAAR